MFRGLYTATSGMMAHNRKQQILTNNLANANTPGFKQDQTVMRSFPAQLIQAMGTGAGSGMTVGNVGVGAQRNIGTLNTGVYLQEGVPSFIQGVLTETGNRTDFSLVDQLLPINPTTEQRGSLVFAVESDNGEIRYTRNGRFTINEEGFLTTGEGYRVLDGNLQPLQVNSSDFTLQGNGEIVFDNGMGAGGEENLRLWIGYTESPKQFVKEGHNLLRWEGNLADLQFIGNVDLVANGDGAGAAAFVRQGFIEQSNVDLTQTMTEMMNTYRSFESNQRIIQAYDRSMEKTVNELGRV